MAVKVVFSVAADNTLYVIVFIEQVPACRRPSQCHAMNHASVYADTEQCPVNGVMGKSCLGTCFTPESKWV